MPTTTGLATSFITFSRPGASGGGATVTDRDGKIKWAGHNLLTNSESFDNSAWTLASVTVATPTKVAANAAVAPNGTTTADEVSFPAITVSTDASLISNSFTAVATTYTGGVWLKAKAAGDVGKKVAVYVDDGSVTNFVFHTLTADWVFVSATEAVSAGTVKLSIAVLGSAYGGGNQGAVSVHLWGAHLYRSDLGGMQLNPAMPAGMQSYYPTTPRNLLGYTEDFSNAAWVKTQIAAFGSGSVANAIVAPNGLQTADKIVASAAAGYHAVRQFVTVTTAPYVFSFYAKAAEYSLCYVTDIINAQFRVAFNLATGAVVAGTTGGGNYVSSAITSVGDGWYRCSISLSGMASNPTFALIGYPSSGATLDAYGLQYTGDGTSGIYLWGAQLSDSASLDTYVPQYGAAVTSAAYYAPRLDFDPVTLAARGLLVEEARTNLLTYSNEVNSWAVRARVTVTENDTTSPAGTTTGAKVLTNAASAGGSYIGRSSGVSTAAGAFCASAYFKKGTSNGWVAIQVGDGTNYYTCWFDITNGAKGTTTSTGTDFTAKNFDIINVGGGWYRCWVTVTRTTTTALEAYYYTDCLSNGSTQTTLNNFDYVYGGQIENGTFPTSFIFTVGNTTATRAADVASVSTQAFPYSASAGSIVANFQLLGGNTGVSLNVVALEGAVGNATLHREGGTWRYRTELANLNLTNVPDAPVNKIGFAYASSDYPLTPNGGAIQTNTGSGLIGSATTLRIGDGTIYASAKQLNGHIRQITYLPRRISNAELQSRSA